MNDINLLYVALDAVSLTLLVLLAIRLVSQTSNVQLGCLLTWVLLGMVCNVVISRQDYGVLIDPGYQLNLDPWYGPLNMLRNSVAGAFMLACHVVFRDGTRLPRLLLTLWIIQILLEEPVAWLVGGGWSAPLETLLYEAVPAVFQVTFMAVALYWMVSSRDADLIIPRRAARTLVIWVVSVNALAMLLVERVAFGFVWVPLDWQYPMHVLIGVSSILLNGLLLFAAFSPHAALVLGAKRRPTTTPAPEVIPLQDDADVGRIQRALEVEHIYRTPGLSVHGLAEHLAIPEYRLRRLVHDHLGFRNFNALLHHYRVNEVCQALADPQQNSKPVLTLALSAGYQSINPFNRAFRDLLGMTPTEYRRSQQQVDS